MIPIHEPCIRAPKAPISRPKPIATPTLQPREGWLDPRDRPPSYVVRNPKPDPRQERHPPVTRFTDPAVRHYDARLGCFVADARRMYPDTPRNRARLELPHSVGRRRFEVFDTASGVRFGTIMAETTTQAAAVIAEWSHGCCYVKEVS